MDNLRNFKEIQKEIEETSIFQKWKKEHSEAYLVHFFLMDEKEVQVGYYSEKTDAMTTFVISAEITKTEDKEIFRQEKKIPALDINAVKITVQEAVQKIDAVQKQKYPIDTVAKKIIVLQTINNIPMYNITFITATFKMINFRLDAATGDVLEEKVQPIMDFVQTIQNKKEQKTE